MAERIPSSLDPLLRPKSIAVIGASRRPNTIGHEILGNLLRHGFTGTVYPVNPTASSVHSIRAYPSVEEIPEVVDLAVVVVPKQFVVEVAESCGRAGVRGLVVITAGFREVGEKGAELERALMDVVERYGMRLVGPNCMGVLNTDPEVSMNATFAPTMPPAGAVAFMSQSGAMGVTILDYAAEYGIGVSRFVSVGNKPDVSGNDLTEYWGSDSAVGPILMYVENFGNPHHFMALARRVTKTKPIIVVKSGRSRAGARAASSHTGAMAGTDIATDALLAQCGVIRVDTVEELFDLAMAFSGQPLPAGPRVAIVTNAGGPGIIIADACEAHGLEVGELTPETRERLWEALPEEASVANPVDMIASATPTSYRRVLETVLDDPGIDAVIATFVPPLGVRQQDVAEAIVEVAARQDEKPVLAVLMGREGLPQGLAELQGAGIPGYRFPESAVRALAAMHRQRRWLERPEGTLRSFEVDAGAVSRILASAREDGRDRLAPHEAMEVLEAYGIPVAGYHRVGSAGEAAEVAERLGGRFVLKAASPRRVHKSDGGGVRLDLEGAEAVREAYEGVAAQVADDPEGGVFLQRMAESGRELIMGVSRDPEFGPLLMFGMGGIYVEVLKDVSFRIQPLTDLDAGEMVRSIRGFPILEGVRGEAGVDIPLVEEALQRISRLIADHPEIGELDVNPWIAYPDGGVAVDSRISLHPAEPSGA